MRLPLRTTRRSMIAMAVVALLRGISARAVASTILLLGVQPSIPMLDRKSVV